MYQVTYCNVLGRSLVLGGLISSLRCVALGEPNSISELFLSHLHIEDGSPDI